MPVPLHPSRKRKRGYNQAQILAEEIGKIPGNPGGQQSLIRTRKDQSAEKTRSPGKKKESEARICSETYISGSKESVVG